MRRVAIALLALLVVSATETRAAGESIEARLAACAEAVRGAPRDRASWACYWQAPLSPAERAVARGALDAQLTIHDGEPWAHFARAVLRLRLSEPGALEDLTAIVRRFESLDEGEWQITARALLAGQLTQRGDYAAAEREIDAMQAIAERAGVADWRVRALERRGWNALRQGDYTTARLAFLRAKALLPADAPAGQRVLVSSALGGVAWAMQRSEEALRHYRDVLAVDPRNAVARANALALVDQVRLEGKGDPEVSRALALAALDPAHGEVTPQIEARAHVVLARLSEGDAAAGHVEAALEAARRSGDPAELRSARRTGGLRLVDLGPPHAAAGLAMIEEAWLDSRRAGGLEDRVRSLDMLTAALCEQGPRESALARQDELLATVETIREIQRDEAVKGGTLAAYARFYHRYAGYLLSTVAEEGGDAGRGGDIETAFGIQERMRARLLLDALDRARATPAAMKDVAPDPEHDALRAAITETQRALRVPGLESERRDALLGELARLELDERERRTARSAADPRFARLRPAAFPSLDEVRGALEPDEALLSFHVAPEHHFGSWLIFVTRESLRALSIPDESTLARDASLLEGLVLRGDGTEAAFARDLGDRLLGEALRSLPPSIKTLVVVPDGPLWIFPFDAARTSARDEPLGQRFDVQLAPSAAVWLRARASAPRGALAGALALGASEVPADWNGDSHGASARERSAPEGWSALPPLPRAHGEARSVAARFGGASEAWIGPAASETRLKAAALDRFAVLHIAAHAVVDDEQPQRSAVVLAPDQAREDGLLQAADIVSLPLQRKIVILSACRGASGKVLRGEGPLALSRAFLEAGASAVVASLWPLRDTDAERAVDALTRRLAGGESLAQALAGAKRALREDGRPASVWAGLVVIGDGSARLAPSDRRWLENPQVLVAAVAVAAALLGLAWWRRHSTSP